MRKKRDWKRIRAVGKVGKVEFKILGELQTASEEYLYGKGASLHVDWQWETFVVKAFVGLREGNGGFKWDTNEENRYKGENDWKHLN